MKIILTQMYIQAGVSFPFNHHFQALASQLFSKAIEGEVFTQNISKKFEALIIVLSAKKGIFETEIRGPTNFRKTNEVQFSLFLAFDNFAKDGNTDINLVIDAIGGGLCKVLSILEIKTCGVLGAIIKIKDELGREPTHYVSPRS